MASIPERDANLRLYYDQVINTHQNLAVVFSNVAGTVVDGRIPNHDLPTMLRDLAEREGIMADNWTLVRDGLLNKLIDNTVLEITGVSATTHADEGEDEYQFQDPTNKTRETSRSEEHEHGGNPKLSKSEDAASVKKAERRAWLEGMIQEYEQRAAHPQTDQEARILTNTQRKKLHEELMRANQAYREAKANRQVEEKLRVDQYRKGLHFKLREQKTIRQLERMKRLEAETKQKARKEQQLATESSARLNKQQEEKAKREAKKAENKARDASARLKKRQREAEKVAQQETRKQEKRTQEIKERIARLVAAPSFPPPRRPRRWVTYKPDDLFIKEEVVEPWDI